MPQPLKALSSGEYEIKWDAVEAFDRYPELGLLVAKCNATWAYAEQGIARFVGDVLGVNAKVVLAILEALTSTTAKLSAIGAIVDVALPKGHEHRPLYEAALKVYRAQAKRRNRLVHHIWGIETKQTPDQLILTDPAVMTEHWWRSCYTPQPKPLSGEKAAKEWLESKMLPADSTFTYSKNDLEGCLRDFRETSEIWHLMSMLVQSHLPDWMLSKDDIRRRLAEKPLMREALPR